MNSLEFPKNLFFVSGPHSGGKTTLLERLSQADSRILIPELETKTPKFHTTPLERMILKICQRPIENYETIEIAEKNPDKIVIGNRCIYDAEAYTKAYFKIGWISEKDKYDLEFLNKTIHLAFPERLRAPKAIVLNPPFEIIKQRLENRWLTKEKKWNEDNMDYLKFACKEYEAYRTNTNILYLENNENVDVVLNWLNETNKIKSVVINDLAI